MTGRQPAWEGGGVTRSGGPVSETVDAVEMPAPVTLEAMRWWHLAEVAELEPRVFTADPWSAELFWSELAQRGSRHYLVARRAGRIIGYAGLAVQRDESFIQTIGVAPEARGLHVATRLMLALLREARRRGARSCGLEVRTDNRPARALYARFGFVDLGLRRGYYQPSGGDAYVMRVRPIHTVGYAALLDGIEAEVRNRGARGADAHGEGTRGDGAHGEGGRNGAAVVPATDRGHGSRAAS